MDQYQSGGGIPMWPEGFKVQRPRVRGPGPLAVGLVWAKRSTSPPARTFDVTEESFLIIRENITTRTFLACAIAVVELVGTFSIFLFILLSWFRPRVFSSSNYCLFLFSFLLLFSFFSLFLLLIRFVTFLFILLLRSCTSFLVSWITLRPRSLLLIWLSSTSSCPSSDYSRSFVSSSPQSSFLLSLNFIFSIYRLLSTLYCYKTFLFNRTLVRQVFSFPEFIFHRTWKFQVEWFSNIHHFCLKLSALYHVFILQNFILSPSSSSF